MTFLKCISLGLAAGLISTWMAHPSLADIRLPKLFSDSMVLQRQAETPLYGQADAEEELTITVVGNDIEKKELKTVCDAEGNFSLKLPAPPVGGPYELIIEGASSSVRIRDIMVGDVWLCSGQSNMEMTVSATNSADEVSKMETNSQLRLLNIERIASPRPLDEFTGAVAWSAASSETAANFSAVGFHFGSDLQQAQRVPIGLISASWGGTLCEAWTSQSALEKNEQLKELYQFGQTNLEGIQKHDQHGALFNGMISPLGRFPLKGVIWYQGESNVGRGAQYAELFPTMIKDWRQHFAQPELPFLFVQLAPFRYESQSPVALAEVWDAQLKTLKNVPHTGMVVTTDLGNFTDIHPVDKQTVGKRLANWAVAEVYNNQHLLQYPKPESETQQTVPEVTPVAPAKKEDKQQLTSVSVGENAFSSMFFVSTLDSRSMIPQEQRETQDKEQPTAENQTSTDPQDQETEGKQQEEVETVDQVDPKLAIYSSPIYKSLETKGNQVVISFYAAEGLKSSDGQPLREFQIAGDDQVFYPAEAKVVGETVVVSSVDVSQPVAVRFAFRDTPEPNLVNKSGLPASPFRTDSFVLESAERDY